MSILGANLDPQRDRLTQQQMEILQRYGRFDDSSEIAMTGGGETINDTNWAKDYQKVVDAIKQGDYRNGLWTNRAILRKFGANEEDIARLDVATYNRLNQDLTGGKAIEGYEAYRGGETGPTPKAELPQRGQPMDIKLAEIKAIPKTEIAQVATATIDLPNNESIAVDKWNQFFKDMPEEQAGKYQKIAINEGLDQMNRAIRLDNAASAAKAAGEKAMYEVAQKQWKEGQLETEKQVKDYEDATVELQPYKVMNPDGTEGFRFQEAIREGKVNDKYLGLLFTPEKVKAEQERQIRLNNEFDSLEGTTKDLIANRALPLEMRYGDIVYNRWGELSDAQKKQVYAFYDTLQPETILGQQIGGKGDAPYVQILKDVVSPIPIVGTAATWDNMSLGWRIASIGLDVACFVPISKLVSMGREAKLGGKAAKAEQAVRDATQWEREALSSNIPELVQPYDRMVKAQKEYAQTLAYAEDAKKNLKTNFSEVRPEIERSLNDLTAQLPELEKKVAKTSREFADGHRRALSRLGYNDDIIQAAVKDAYDELGKNNIKSIKSAVDKIVNPPAKNPTKAIQKELAVANAELARGASLEAQTARDMLSNYKSWQEAGGKMGDALHSDVQATRKKLENIASKNTATRAQIQELQNSLESAKSGGPNKLYERWAQAVSKREAIEAERSKFMKTIFGETREDGLRGLDNRVRDARAEENTLKNKYTNAIDKMKKQDMWGDNSRGGGTRTLNRPVKDTTLITASGRLVSTKPNRILIGGGGVAGAAGAATPAKTYAKTVTSTRIGETAKPGSVPSIAPTTTPREVPSEFPSPTPEPSPNKVVPQPSPKKEPSPGPRIKPMTTPNIRPSDQPMITGKPKLENVPVIIPKPSYREAINPFPEQGPELQPKPEPYPSRKPEPEKYKQSPKPDEPPPKRKPPKRIPLKSEKKTKKEDTEKATGAAIAQWEQGALGRGKLKRPVIISLTASGYKRQSLGEATEQHAPGQFKPKNTIRLLTGKELSARARVGAQEAIVLNPAQEAGKPGSIQFKPINLGVRKTAPEIKIRVAEVDSKELKDYAGMNRDAAKVLGFHMKPGVDIELDKGVSPGKERRNLTHELTEMAEMEKGTQYWNAHLKALKAERRPIRIIKRHDDGDLTVKTPGGDKFVVTTEGGLFKQVKPKQSLHLRSEKFGPLWHTKVEGGTILSRFPLSRRRRRRSK